MLRELKRNPHRITGFHLVNDDATIILETDKGTYKQVLPLEYRESDRYSNGSFVIDTDQEGQVANTQLESRYQKYFNEEEIN